MNNSNAYRNAQSNVPTVITSSDVNIKKEEVIPEPIVVSGVSKKKKTFGMKVKELFVKEDAKSFRRYFDSCIYEHASRYDQEWGRNDVSWKNERP